MRGTFRGPVFGDVSRFSAGTEKYYNVLGSNRKYTSEVGTSTKLRVNRSAQNVRKKKQHATSSATSFPSRKRYTVKRKSVGEVCQDVIFTKRHTVSQRRHRVNVVTKVREKC